MVRGVKPIAYLGSRLSVLSRSDFEADRITSASISISYAKKFIPCIASDGLTS